jgi:hypothetical protein
VKCERERADIGRVSNAGADLPDLPDLAVPPSLEAILELADRIAGTSCAIDEADRLTLGISEDDGDGFIAWAPELGVLAHGNTVDAARCALVRSVRRWLEHLRDDVLGVGLDDDDERFVRLLAVAEGVWFHRVVLMTA